MDEIRRAGGWSPRLYDPAAPTPAPARAPAWPAEAPQAGPLAGLERAALRLAGLRAGERSRVVRAMLLRRRRQRAGFWLTLLLSAGMATLGLALGSSAVVIGAMLVSPLMVPILELGMGLVTGSPVLTLRALIRTVGGVAAVVAAAALLTLLLPFQEITPEITARTAPTALDLLVAAFVAVAAVFMAVRPRSDAAAIAAGTALGIALVPPLCVAGFGLGSQNLAAASGAGLLFLANFSAVMAAVVGCLLVLGFEHVDTGPWDRRALRLLRTAGVRRAAEGLRALFGSRFGRGVRLGLPLLLLAAVAVPLGTALRRVAWEVRARSAVGRALAEVPAGDVVQSAVSVRGRAVDVRLYLLGTPLDAAAVEKRIKAGVMRVAADAEATVRVVPLAGDRPPPPPMAAVAGDPAATLPELVALRERLGQALEQAWPATGAGEVLRWELRWAETDSVHVVPTHLGDPLADGTRGLLSRIMSESAGLPVAVAPVAIPGSVRVPRTEAEDWLEYLERSAPLLRANRSLQLCLRIPEAGVPEALRSRVDTLLAVAAPGQVERVASASRLGASLSLYAEDTPCAGSGPAPDR